VLRDGVGVGLSSDNHATMTFCPTIVERLASAIRIATSDTAMQARTVTFGQQIREENGVAPFFLPLGRIYQPNTKLRNAREDSGGVRSQGVGDYPFTPDSETLRLLLRLNATWYKRC
jgi:hypothetical protein